MTDQELKDLVAQNSADIKVLVAQTTQLAAVQTEYAKAQAAQAKEQAMQAKAQAAFAKEQTAQIKAQTLAADARFDKLAAKYGGLSDNLGSAAEEFFVNSLEARPIVGGIRFDAVHPKVFGGKMGKQSEYDIVLVNGASAAIIEVKHKVHPSALDQLEAQLAKYKEHFPEHKDFALYGGIAGMSIPDEVVAQAKARGLFVLKCKGEVMEADITGMRAF
jgi:multidrug efflux pump subunit AcrA (membrane-fusion protein)